MALVTLTLIAVSIGGCASRRGNLCDGWKPIIVTEMDGLTMDDKTKRQIVSHNEFGEKQCGWKPLD